MDLIVPTLSLTEVSGSFPTFYELKVAVNTTLTSGKKLVAHRGLPPGPDNDGITRIRIAMDSTNGSAEMLIDLIGMSLDPVDGEIEVILEDDAASEIGKNRTRAEEAHKESRPIRELF